MGQRYVGGGCEWSTAAGCVGVEGVCVRVVVWMACVCWVGVMVLFGGGGGGGGGDVGTFTTTW